MTDGPKPIYRWMARATFPASNVGELMYRHRLVAEAAGRRPQHAEDAGFLAAGEREVSAEWNLETRREARTIEAQVRAVTDRIPALVVFAKERSGRVINEHEFETTAADLRDRRSICMFCGAAVGQRVVPAHIASGTKVPVKCVECDFLNDFVILTE